MYIEVMYNVQNVQNVHTGRTEHIKNRNRKNPIGRTQLWFDKVPAQDTISYIDW